MGQVAENVVEQGVELPETVDQLLEEENTFDAFAALTQRHSGVQCPNPECGDRIFSYDKGPSVSCRCGLAWVSGGLQLLKCGVGAPYSLPDLRIVSQPLLLPEETEEVISEVPEVTEAEIAEVLGETPVDSTPRSVDDSAAISTEETTVPSDDNLGLNSNAVN